jgi:hypothetical protein
VTLTFGLFATTMQKQIEQLRTDLKRAQERGDSPGVFGAEAHEFALNPPLIEGELAAFEAAHGVTLPEEYRLFLLVVGNGGAGPYYGLFRLGEMDEGFAFAAWEEGSFVGELTATFPHHAPWNDLSGAPDDEDWEEEGYERSLDEFETRYFDSALVNGAIPICHRGCALRKWLVVSGPEAGNVWCDDRADRRGIYPLTVPDKERVTFYQWYRDWLDAALSVRRARPN